MDRLRSIRIAVLHTVLVVLISAVVLSVVFYFGGKQIRAIRGEAEQLEKRHSDILSKRDALPKIVESLPYVLEDARMLTRMFPNNPGDKELLDFMELLAKDVGAVVVGIQLGEGEEMQLQESKLGKSDLLQGLDELLVWQLKAVEMRITLRGNFQSLVGFLERLKEHGRFIRVYNVSGPSEVDEKEFMPSLMEWDIKANMIYSTSETTTEEKFQRLVEEIRKVMVVEVGEMEAEDKSAETATLPSEKSEKTEESGKSAVAGNAMNASVTTASSNGNGGGGK